MLALNVPDEGGSRNVSLYHGENKLHFDEIEWWI